MTWVLMGGWRSEMLEGTMIWPGQFGQSPEDCLGICAAIWLQMKGCGKHRSHSQSSRIYLHPSLPWKMSCTQLIKQRSWFPSFLGNNQHGMLAPKKMQFKSIIQVLLLTYRAALVQGAQPQGLRTRLSLRPKDTQQTMTPQGPDSLATILTYIYRWHHILNDHGTGCE
jgi:hypothetical protein